MTAFKNILKKKSLFIKVFFIFAITLLSCKDKDKDQDPVFFNPNIAYGSLKDQEGNTYKTVVIGDQVWMAENLKTRRYRNGDTIPIVKDSLWDDLTTGAYCNYNNDDNILHRGRLYNWWAVNDPRGLSPDGWHIPSDSDWIELINYLGEENAGGKLKETGLAHWFSPNTGASNSSGFTALGAGARYESDFFFGSGLTTGFWTTTSVDTTTAWHYSLSSNYEKVGKYVNNKTLGFSVRCVKD